MARSLERDHQWDFKAGKDKTALAYLYLDGKNGSTVAVGQNYRGYKGLEPPPGKGTDYSWYSGDKDIPSTASDGKKNFTVTKIATWAFMSAANVHKVTLPPTIVEIEDEAFKYCGGINIISLNEGLKKIGKMAFFYCTNLNSIIIPDSVATIGSQAFDQCLYLTEATIGARIASMADVFKSCRNLTKVTCRAIVPPVITKDAFADETYQNAVLYVPFASWDAYKKSTKWGKFNKIEPIPETIPTGIFYFIVDGIRYKTKAANSNEVYVAPLLKDVYKAKTINIPKEVVFANKKYFVTGIDEYAFRDSTTPIVKIPNSIKTIRFGAFDHAEIKSIAIPDSVKTIEAEAFYSCMKLTEIEIPSGVTTIYSSTFEGCENIKRVVLHKGLNKISRFAFDDMYALQELEIPDTVVEIGESAFSNSCYDSPKRLSITIPNKVTTIGARAFSGCRLKSVTLGKGLTKIENSVFEGCEFKELVIPKGITSIGNKAFADNDNNFQTITCESTTPPKAEADTFDPLTFENATLKVPKPAVDDYMKDPVWGKFDQIIGVAVNKKPANAKTEVMPEPIRYISLSNKGGFMVRIRVKCEDGTFVDNRIISLGMAKTVDLADVSDLIKDGYEVWMEASVTGGANKTANQIFVYKKSSNKKANYAIKGTTLNSVLNYLGLSDI